MQSMNPDGLGPPQLQLHALLDGLAWQPSQACTHSLAVFGWVTSDLHQKTLVRLVHFAGRPTALRLTYLRTAHTTNGRTSAVSGLTTIRCCCLPASQGAPVHHRARAVTLGAMPVIKPTGEPRPMQLNPLSARLSPPRHSLTREASQILHAALANPAQLTTACTTCHHK